MAYHERVLGARRQNPNKPQPPPHHLTDTSVCSSPEVCELPFVAHFLRVSGRRAGCPPCQPPGVTRSGKKRCSLRPTRLLPGPPVSPRLHSRQRPHLWLRGNAHGSRSVLAGPGAHPAPAPPPVTPFCFPWLGCVSKHTGIPPPANPEAGLSPGSTPGRTPLRTLRSPCRHWGPPSKHVGDSVTALSHVPPRGHALGMGLVSRRLPERGQDIPGQEEAGPQLCRGCSCGFRMWLSAHAWSCGDRSLSVLTARPAGHLSRLQVAHRRWRRPRPGRLMAFLQPSPAPCASLSGREHGPRTRARSAVGSCGPAPGMSPPLTPGPEIRHLHKQAQRRLRPQLRAKPLRALYGHYLLWPTPPCQVGVLLPLNR